MFNKSDYPRRRSSDSASWTPVILSVVVTLAVLGIEGTMVLIGTPQNIEPVLLGRIIGTLETGWLMVMGYWFSASASDKSKDAAIHSMAREIKTDDVNVQAKGDVMVKGKK